MYDEILEKLRKKYIDKHAVDIEFSFVFWKFKDV